MKEINKVLFNQVMDAMLLYYPVEHHPAIRTFMSEKLDNLMNQTFDVTVGKVTVTMNLSGYFTDVKINRLVATVKDQRDLVEATNKVLDELPKHRSFALDLATEELRAFFNRLLAASPAYNQKQEAGDIPTPEELN